MYTFEVSFLISLLFGRKKFFRLAPVLLHKLSIYFFDYIHWCKWDTTGGKVCQASASLFVRDFVTWIDTHMDKHTSSSYSSIHETRDEKERMWKERIQRPRSRAWTSSFSCSSSFFLSLLLLCVQDERKGIVKKCLTTCTFSKRVCWVSQERNKLKHERENVPSRRENKYQNLTNIFENSWRSREEGETDVDHFAEWRKSSKVVFWIETFGQR